MEKILVIMNRIATIADINLKKKSFIESGIFISV